MGVYTPAFAVRNASGTTREYLLPLNKLDATAAPGVNDDSGDGYIPGSMWIDVTNDETYFCEDNTLGAAVWKQVGGSVSAPLELQISDAATNTVVYPLVVSHITSGTVATGFGVGIEFDLENDSGTKVPSGMVEVYWDNLGVDETHMDLSTYEAGVKETLLRLESNGNRVRLPKGVLDLVHVASGNLVSISPTTLTADRSVTFPDAAGEVILTTATQTLTNKTLTAPVISTIVNTGTLTLPTSTDTLVGRATTDTLTNKTLTTPTIGSFANATHTHQDAAGGGTLNAAAIAAGTVDTARLGSGSATASTFLAGDQSYKEPIGLTPIFIAYPSSTKTATTLTWTQIDANTETLDTNNWYNTTTYRFVPQVAGYYAFYGLATVNDLAAAAEMVMAIYKNGSEAWRGLNVISPATNSDVGTNGTAIVQCNGSTDYIEFFARHSNGSNRDFKAGPTDCFWMGWRVR